MNRAFGPAMGIVAVPVRRAALGAGAAAKGSRENFAALP
jgi:hypothetical protein